MQSGLSPAIHTSTKVKTRFICSTCVQNGGNHRNHNPILSLLLPSPPVQCHCTHTHEATWTPLYIQRSRGEFAERTRLRQDEHALSPALEVLCRSAYLVSHFETSPSFLT